MKDERHDEIPTVREKIQQLRAQMLIHSYLYYHRSDPIVSDAFFDRQARSLADLQKRYPEHCMIDFYDNAFLDWDGDTGFHLPVDDWVRYKSTQIFRLHKHYHKDLTVE